MEMQKYEHGSMETEVRKAEYGNPGVQKPKYGNGFCT